jgi:GNAT superfamily N-acetyltransferase
MGDMEKGEQIKITVYKELYKEQVIRLVGNSLVEQSVIEASCTPIDDDDLHHIPELYIGRGRFWVALKGDELVGTVGIRDLGEGLAILKRMFVKSTYHGSGLGQQLLDTALQFARSKGYTRITLNTHKNMKRAHHFYEKNGFLFTKEKKKDMYTYERVL